MQTQIHYCQNCKKDFIVDENDFSFYEKVQVPPPTFCPSCRFQRRMAFRNERVLYRRTCGLCQKPVVSIFSPERNLPVYCVQCWWGDGWDPLSYGQDYDSSRNFFEQFMELQKKVPLPSLATDYGTLVNCDFVNHCGHSKNCYLCFNGDFMENVYYGTTVSTAKDSMDGMMWNKVELSYELIDGNGSKIFYSENCDECIDVLFSKNCVGCINCFGCVNLRKKSYYFFNEPCTKEEYEKKVAAYNLGSYKTILELREKAYAFWLEFPRKSYYGRKNIDSTGDYIYYSKNLKQGYQCVTAEDSAYCQFLTVPKTTSCYDITEWGQNADLCYDTITAGDQASLIKFCSFVWGSAARVEYSLYAPSGTEDCFGCISTRKKKYCILNKQYTKEEYEKLRAQIIEDMKNNPYVDAKGRVWKYGEFFPYDASPFGYNESQAIQYFPLTIEQISEKGFRYITPQKPNYAVTLAPGDIPDDILEVPDTITKEVLECIGCRKPYKIVPGEFQLLKRFGLPIPRKCADCRHMDRMARVNPPYLYNRICMKCEKPIVTSYPESRPEIVYCEECYQKDVE